MTGQGFSALRSKFRSNHRHRLQRFSVERPSFPPTWSSWTRFWTAPNLQARSPDHQVKRSTMIFSSRRKGSESKHSWFGLHRPFDPKYRLVTSGLVQPWVLFTIRLIMAIYCTVTSIVHVILYLRPSEQHAGYSEYIYFTRLNYIGMTAYFDVAAFHSGIFVLNLRRLRNRESSDLPWYPLQKWGPFFQFLHLYLFSTIITFPIIITITYWGFLKDDETFATKFSTWSNVSYHMLNTVFLVVEFIFGRGRLYWGYLIPIIITLGLYLGLAYLVHDVDHIWVYNLLDPTKHNPAAFIAGVPCAEIVVYFVVWGLIHIRDWILPRGRGVRVVEPGDTVRV